MPLPPALGFQFQEEQGTNNSNQIKHSAFTSKRHQIFLSQIITLPSCLTEPVLGALALQAGTS